MKIIEMQRKTLSGEPVVYGVGENGEDYTEWWCVIETKEEELVYEDFLKHLGEYCGDPREILWNKLVIHAGQGLGLKWGDDDIYAYLRPDEDVPEVGEEDVVVSGGDTWLRLY